MNALPEKNVVGAVALVLGVIGLGWIGAHKIMMGYTKQAIIMIVVSIVTCGVGAVIFSIISIIEGIILLTKTNQAYQSEYSDGRRPWL